MPNNITCLNTVDMSPLAVQAFFDINAGIGQRGYVGTTFLALGKGRSQWLMMLLAISRVSLTIPPYYPNERIGALSFSLAS